jgi:O-antigen/teichoic acid export membrane protein
MKPRVQFILGIFNSLASALAMLAMAPIYLRYLGAEAYGLIGFYTTLLICTQVFDVGMSTVVNRDIARNESDQLTLKNGHLLRTVELVQACVCALIALTLCIFTPWLASGWLAGKLLDAVTIKNALYGIAIAVALRFPISMYQAALFGRQKMHYVSCINIVQISLMSIGGYILIAYFAIGIAGFFLWLVLVGFLHLLCLRTAAWFGLEFDKLAKLDWLPLRNSLKFSLGAAYMSTAGLILLQVDKVVLSKTIDLEHYGYYMLAAMVAGGINLIIAPAYNLYFPMFTKLIQSKQGDALLSRYKLYTSLTAGFIFPLVLYLMFFLPQIIAIWVGNSVVAQEVSSIARILLFATAIHALMSLQHALILASGIRKRHLLIHGILLATSPMITVALAIKYGALGGALGQLAHMLIYIVVGTVVTHKYTLIGYGSRWIIMDIAPALVVVTFAAACIVYFKLNALQLIYSSHIALSLVGFCMLVLVCMLSAKSTQDVLIGFLKSNSNRT